MIKKQLLLVLATATIALVSACGGGGGGGGSLPAASTGTVTPTSPPTTTPGNTATAAPTVTMSLTVSIPGKKSSARARGPQYIAPNSGSMTLTLLTVNGVAVNGAIQGPFNLTAGASNPNCTANQSGTTCTFSISAPIGTDIFLANTYTSSNGTGTPLGSGSILLTVRQNTQNSANLSLTGPVASVQVVTATATLYNGNPVPAPQCSACSVARGSGAQAKVVIQARSAAAAASASRSTTAVSRSTATASTRKTLGAVSSPPPVPATATTSRIFVIALDAAGNQIINPTTFDIPINLTLALNGTPAGGVTLTVTYAGLTGEPSSPASTTADGGIVQVYAPSDQVTMTLSGTSALTGSFAPTITASYTPQGGTLQTTAPLAYTVYMPVPAAQLAASVSHTPDPFTVGVAGTVNEAYLNTGTAPTSGQLEADAYLSYLSYNGTATGSDPSWSCTPYNEGSYYYVQCYSNAVVPAGGSLPLNFSVTPTGNNPAYNELDVYGGSAVNGTNDIWVQETITVLTAVPALSISQTTTALTDGNFAQGTSGSFNITVSNTGTVATTGPVQLVDVLPNYLIGTGTGAGWTCNSVTSTPTTTVTCTTNAVLASGGGTVPVITITGTPTVAGVYTNALTATSAGANTGTLNPSVSVYGPLTLTPQAPSAPDHLQLFLGAAGTVQASEGYYYGTLTASIVNGAFGSPPCSNYLSLQNSSGTGPFVNFNANPLQVTNVLYSAGNPATYCTISVSDGNGLSATIPVTVTSVTLNGQ